MVRSRDQLRPYQLKAVEWVNGRYAAGLLLDMGLGKTVVVLTSLGDLATLSLPALIIAPIRVIKTVWRQEAAKWEHTQGLRFSLVYGSPQERIAALLRPADIYLVNPHTIQWLFGGKEQSTLGRMVDEIDLTFDTHKLLDVEELPGVAKVLQLRFGTLVVDESSLFKNQSTGRFKALRSVVPRFRRRMILTGTPRPNSAMDLWSQTFILDEGARLGSSFYRFRDRFFAPADREGFSYTPRKGANEYIDSKIQDIMLRLDARDWLDIPPTLYNTVKVELPPEARKLYERFEREMIIELAEAEAEVVAVNAGVLTMKCQQIANGAIYYEDEEAKRQWQLIHDAKLEALQEIIDEAGGPVIVCYHFAHDAIRLKRQFPGAPVFTEAKNTERLITEWGKGKHPVMFLHSASAGHGVDRLQYGGNRICFFSLTWSGENHDQVIARVGGARQVGLADKTIVHYIVAEDTIDEGIMRSTQAKIKGQNETLNYLRDYVRGLELLH